MEHHKYTEYIGETSAGLLFDLHFKPGIITAFPDNCHYCKFISWSDIYCGRIKIRVKDGEDIRAVREDLEGLYARR